MTSQKHIEHIIFDLDGTLVNSLETGLKIANRIRFLFGYDKLDPNDPNLRLKSGYDFAKDILKLNKLQIILWAGLVKTLMVFKTNSLPLYDDWEHTLKKLSKKFKLSIITSSTKSYARNLLNHHNIENYFHHVITDVHYDEKARALKKYLKTHQLNNKQVMYLGDEVRDYKACKQANIPFLAVSWGKDHPTLFDFQDQLFLGILETPSAIKNII